MINHADPDPIAHARPQAWAGALLRLAGWHLDLPPPPAPKVVLVVYPHTSNWDFLWGILAKWSCGWPVRWIGKDSLFRSPVGRLLRAWGGIPVDRAAPEGFLQALLNEIEAAPTVLLAIAPEGTRRHVPCWKSGFLRLARAGKMPLGLAYIDYARRTVGIRTYLMPSDDDAADMARIAQAYEGVVARNPANAGAIRLRPPSA
ncbi:1-acyl-sn-glycerol-3-phosphate acyltransferase [Niveibacterium sp. SC-1]|uniref:1-acyl-sn-glycerol-3-phosphate acyltransferase n=1 Tax=Niveibacterium sp. SC-1 TaxID=3135646 RepID=UPI00311D7217